MMAARSSALPEVVVLGGGFGGLEAVKSLAKAPVHVTLVDRNNYHLFQPLLYQVASATLSGVDIAAPLRHILKNQSNAEVLQGEAVRVDPEQRKIFLKDGKTLSYDFLIVATGASHSYFGKDQWAAFAPGLKTLEDALEVRRRFLSTFEQAEWEEDPVARKALLTFVVVGGGPTGVELAGTLKEMSRMTLPREFRRIQTEQARVILVESGPRILATFGEGLSERAQRSLEKIGVEIVSGRAVTDVDEDGIRIGDERIVARTVLWAAGVAPSPLGKQLGLVTDKKGFVPVGPDLSVEGHSELFVIGDLASFKEHPLPGLAPVAIQEGRAAARNIIATLRNEERRAFSYRDRGTMATVGRGSAIAQIGRYRLSGFIAWLAWLFIHLMMLVGFENRIVVFVEWCWAYLTTQRRARLIIRSAFHPGAAETQQGHSESLASK